VTLPTGWPYTARHTSIGYNSPIPSAMLDAVEDRVVDLYRYRTKILFAAFPELKGSSPNAIPGWYETGGGAGPGIVQGSWRAQDTSSRLLMPIELPVGASIYKVEIKYDLNSASGMVIDLVSETPYFDTPTSVPVGGAAVLGTASPATTATPDVAVIDISATPHQIGVDDLVYLIVHSHDVGDDIFCARVTYIPVVPTP
jgi:hypothetical protein